MCPAFYLWCSRATSPGSCFGHYCNVHNTVEGSTKTVEELTSMAEELKGISVTLADLIKKEDDIVDSTFQGRQ